ncbi:PaaI family thioesterase [Mycobacterium sp. 852002-51057_SCH5723018]|uniref:PaaI family thioesterase n=1 Tax=Mycobacterium sp. 852002-51057_SCH5723018 TaxID=1834094 RepID=UPI00080235B5|nr:PaaI family thioesterase [Mycobacterium sp. 852002-51057_SCH5723018]OBG24235.1 thioesterase [Mycobacterium sp. 852002-51057_SCH5723018]
MTDNGDAGAPVYEPLAESVRRLIDATIRTEAGADAVEAAKAHVDRAVELLSDAPMPASFGVRGISDGQPLASGNVMIGRRNPVAPPLVIHRDADGAVWTEVILGAAYEGPPGHVHGGVCALLLDHVLGATAHQPGRPAYTGTLTLRYARGTPLGPVRAEAHVDRIEGTKTFAKGHIADTRGVTVTAEGVFIIPTRQATAPRLS